MTCTLPRTVREVESSAGLEGGGCRVIRNMMQMVKGGIGVGNVFGAVPL